MLMPFLMSALCRKSRGNKERLNVMNELIANVNVQLTPLHDFGEKHVLFMNMFYRTNYIAGERVRK